MRKLTGIEQRNILRELAERDARSSSVKVAAQPTEAELESCDKLKQSLFYKQRRFFFPPAPVARRRIACTSRRSGKTTGDAAKMLVTGTENPRSVSLYVGQTSITARETIWPIVIEMASDFDLPFAPHQTTLTMRHTRSTGGLLFKGADTVREMQKRRGLKLLLAILDESGSFGEDVEQLVVSIVGPALRDQLGEFLMTGTPGDYPVGMFYEAQEGLRPNWERQFWTLQDNPFLPPEAKDLALIREEEGLTEDDPIYIREWTGKYALNLKTQMFSFDPRVNTFAPHEMPPIDSLFWILSIDFGWTDAAAIVPMGWSVTSPTIWIPEGWEASEQTSDDIAAKVTELSDVYHPRWIVGDTGGGSGKQMAGQLWRDYQMYVTPAQKREKLQHINFINAAFKRGEIRVAKSSPIVNKYPKILWNSTRTDTQSRSDDHAAMAILYGWRKIANMTGSTRKKPAEDPAVTEIMGVVEPEKRRAMLENHIQRASPWYLQPIGDDFYV